MHARNIRQYLKLPKYFLHYFTKIYLRQYFVFYSFSIFIEKTLEILIALESFYVAVKYFKLGADASLQCASVMSQYSFSGFSCK